MAYAQFEPTINGITKISLQTDSFLSAASFQSSVKVLTQVSLKTSTDFLLGLKENVIVNELIPSGTGLFVDSKKKINASNFSHLFDSEFSNAFTRHLLVNAEQVANGEKIFPQDQEIMNEENNDIDAENNEIINEENNKTINAKNNEIDLENNEIIDDDTRMNKNIDLLTN
uniref:Rna polymerase beta'-subunit n=1 Tax=Trentepohlia odorata TaxID=2576626 RepID=A0A4Y5P3K7_9CHLO|nr:rna polymerase beta'-subunit [Trentepohlia odorata]QCW57822.1 rna polymerase beta'-subunit [Trentepohlia odorata]